MQAIVENEYLQQRLKNAEEQIQYLQQKHEECEKIWNTTCSKINELMINLIEQEQKLMHQIQSVQEQAFAHLSASLQEIEKWKLQAQRYEELLFQHGICVMPPDDKGKNVAPMEIQVGESPHFLKLSIDLNK